MLKHFRMMADYNRWANARLLAACGSLTEAEYKADKGAFFGSLHGTLNHLLAADRIWQKRLSGEGDAPDRLDAILCETFAALAKDRAQEDQRIIAWMDRLDENALSSSVTYTPITVPEPVTQPLGPALAHVFNHQTHHRGQCHAILTALGKPSIVLDLITFLRSDGLRWM